MLLGAPVVFCQQEHFLSTGAMVYRLEQTWRLSPSTGAILEAVPAVFCRLEQRRQEQCFVDARNISTTGAMFCGQAQGFIGRKHSTGAVVEAVPAVFCRQEHCGQEHRLVDRSNVLSTGARFYRQEALDRSSSGGCPSGILSTGTLICRPEQSWTLSQPCFVDRSHVDRSNVLSTGAMFCRQEACFVELRLGSAQIP